MSPPDTRPSELAEIVNNEQAFRLYVVQRLERYDGRLSVLERQVTGVSSSVGEGEKAFSKYDGIKIGIGIATSFFLMLGTAIWAVFTFFVSNKP